MDFVANNQRWPNVGLSTYQTDRQTMEILLSPWTDIQTDIYFIDLNLTLSWIHIHNIYIIVYKMISKVTYKYTWYRIQNENHVQWYRHCASESIYCRLCCWSIVGLMVGHRLRRLAIIKSAFAKRPVIVESSSLLAIFHSFEQLSALNEWKILVCLQTKLVRICKFSSPYPTNARRWPNVGFMLGQRLRWWPNIGCLWDRPL